MPIWRDKDTVQFGVDPRRAVAISGLRAAAEVIRLLDGSREREQLVTEATGRGVPAAVTERILTLLAAAGALIDYPAAMLRTAPPELRGRLLPELTAVSLSARPGDGGASVLARRSASRVAVCGAGDLASAITDLLTRSGVACLSVPGPAPRPDQDADLLVLTRPVAPELQAELNRARTPHLAVSATEAIGIVGPLVEPGITACLRCLDLARAARDPAWPLVLAQLSRPRDDGPCAVLAATVAAQAAAQAIAFVDQLPIAAATSNGTLELVWPAWQWRRRSWQPHQSCSCATAVTLSRPSGPVRTAMPVP
jgi:hypothetical protein